MEITGTIALVTGAGSGLGEATARRLADLGARVAVLDRGETEAARVAAEIGGVAVAADVGDAAAVEAAFARAATLSAARHGSWSAAPASEQRRASCRGTAR